MPGLFGEAEFVAIYVSTAHPGLSQDSSGEEDLVAIYVGTAHPGLCQGSLGKQILSPFT